MRERGTETKKKKINGRGKKGIKDETEGKKEGKKGGESGGASPIRGK